VLLAGRKDYYFAEDSGRSEFVYDLGGRSIGKHGYDPNEESMRAVFFAMGPSFPLRQKDQHLNVRDIAPLVRKALDL